MFSCKTEGNSGTGVASCGEASHRIDGGMGVEIAAAGAIGALVGIGIIVVRKSPSFQSERDCCNSCLLILYVGGKEVHG